MYRMFPPSLKLSPTTNSYCSSFFFFSVTFFYILSHFPIVYNLNVDPIVYLSILIYPWSTNLPVDRDHQDREILNRQILLCEEGDSLISKIGYLLRLPQSSSIFHLSSPTNSCIASNLKHGPPPQIISGIVGEPRAANRTLNSKPSGCTSLARIASSVGNQDMV